MISLIKHARAPLRLLVLMGFCSIAAPVYSAPMPVGPATLAVELVAAQIAPTAVRYHQGHRVRHGVKRHSRHRGHYARHSRLRHYHRLRYYNPDYDTSYEPDYAPVYRPPLVYAPEPDYGYGYSYRFRRHDDRRDDAGESGGREWRSGNHGRGNRHWRREENNVSQPSREYRSPNYRQPDRIVGEPRRRFDQGDGARYPVQQRQPVTVQQPRGEPAPRFSASPRAIERQEAPRQRLEPPRRSPGNCAPGQNCGAPR